MPEQFKPTFDDLFGRYPLPHEPGYDAAKSQLNVDRFIDNYFFDYARFNYYRQAHHARFVKRVMQTRLLCQECRGRGGEIEPIYLGCGPWMDCGWCEGTGFVTPHLRGLWLRYQKGDSYGDRRGLPRFLRENRNG